MRGAQRAAAEARFIRARGTDNASLARSGEGGGTSGNLGSPTTLRSAAVGDGLEPFAQPLRVAREVVQPR